jgi:hypothetical protein
LIMFFIFLNRYRYNFFYENNRTHFNNPSVMKIEVNYNNVDGLKNSY